MTSTTGYFSSACLKKFIRPEKVPWKELCRESQSVLTRKLSLLLGGWGLGFDRKADTMKCLFKGFFPFIFYLIFKLLIFLNAENV